MMDIKKYVYTFVFALVFYSAVQVINWQFGNISPTILGLLEIGAIAVMIFVGRKIFNEFEFENKYFKFIFFLFIVYELIIVVRGFPNNYPVFKYNLQSDFLFWPFIVPFVVFLKKNDLTFFYFIKAFYLLAIAFLFFTIINPFLVTQRITAETFIHAFVFTCSLILFNSKYVSRKISLVAFVALTIAFLSLTYLARRNGMVSYGGVLLVGGYFVFRNMKMVKAIRFFPLFAGFLILILYNEDILVPKLTGKLSERLNEDTRSVVFSNFFKGMDEYMFFGKGMNGTYYSPIEEMITEDGVVFGEIVYRDVIENGYLQLLLSGGYFHVALFVLTLLPAALLGIFKSNNQLTRACGVIIILWMVDMFIYGMPRLVMQYILVWMSAGICYKASFRYKSDDEIQDSFEEVGLA